MAGLFSSVLPVRHRCGGTTKVIGEIHAGVGQFLELFQIVAAVNDAGVEEGAGDRPSRSFSLRPLNPAFSPVGEKVSTGRMRGNLRRAVALLAEGQTFRSGTVAESHQGHRRNPRGRRAVWFSPTALTRLRHLLPRPASSAFTDLHFHPVCLSLLR